MIKRIIAMSMAIILAAGMLLPAVYADSGTAAPQVTVVGKRIIGDDKYFEISLEVDGDYEDYSSVGVVLQYDPSLIVPTTWDDEAVPVDMSQSTSWATRRALPTLGKDTWTTHTALTYITEETDSGGNKKNVGYLYLGAEYPGKLPNSASDPNATPDPNATASPTVAPTPTAEPTPTPDPNATPDPDPYVNPVVVARFMYVGADETAQKASKDSITNQWTAGNWDADWTKNKILTIAPDKISDASPAQFGFTIYNADFTMKGFQFDYTTTVLETAEQAQTTDIQIVLGEGKSAKAGGLSLNDIYVTLFYDWDDSLLGTFTCGVGVDSSADINEYVKTKLIHPDLQSNTNYTSTARVDNYRGEYPSAGPNSTNPTLPGGAGSYPETIVDTNGDTIPNPNRASLYPLTNKLEYCFAGRDFNTDDSGNALPFVGGWTKVAPDTMEDTWTALSTENFAQTVDTDGNEIADKDADGDLIDADGNKIDMVSYDFSDVQSTDLDGGALYVKAVYTPGDMLGNGDSAYVAIGPLKIAVLVSGSSSSTYSISFDYRRINKFGYGVSKMKKPSVRMDLTQVGASASTSIEVLLQNGEVIPVALTPTNAVKTLGYQLVETNNSNVINGTSRSLLNGVDNAPIQLQGADGLIFSFTAQEYLKQAYDGTVAASGFTAAVFKALKLSQTTAGAAISAAAKRKTCTNAIKKLVKDAEAAGQDYLTLSWYQLQYAVLNTSAPYVSNAVAKAYCEQYPALMAKING